MSSTILSTKKLSIAQRELLLNAKLNIVEYDAIKISFNEFQIEKVLDFYLFTSQNAVCSFIKNHESLSSPIKKELGLRAFCVGEKTKNLLQQHHIEVVAFANSAEELADILVKNYCDYSFLLFCGNMRRDELPKTLKAHKVKFEEVEVYQTTLNPKKFNRTFDGILFFSPSGVRSFSTLNDLSKSMAFCIGRATSSQVKKYTHQFIQANKPTIENVIVQAVKHYQENT